jgi:chemotaxis protein methyltransferase CheR
MILADQEFDQIRLMLYERFGISLGDQKRALVVGRLNKLLTLKGFNSFGQFIDYLKGDTTGVAFQELVDRMSTNHTFFFREATHFEFFGGTVLPELLAKIKDSAHMISESGVPPRQPVKNRILSS